MNGTIIKKGDNVKISQRVVEGKKERTVPFTGRVLNVKGSGMNRMFTVRQTIESIDVDRIFPVESPTISKIEKVEEKSAKRVSRVKTSRSKKSKSSR